MHVIDVHDIVITYNDCNITVVTVHIIQYNN